MTVLIEPRAGEKYSDQTAVANKLLSDKTLRVDEVVLRFNEGERFMRRPMTEEELKEFIYPR